MGDPSFRRSNWARENLRQGKICQGGILFCDYARSRNAEWGVNHWSLRADTVEAEVWCVWILGVLICMGVRNSLRSRFGGRMCIFILLVGGETEMWGMIFGYPAYHLN